MASNKRRRSINIDTAYIDNLRVKATEIGTTHTGLASQIFIGMLPPLTNLGRSNRTKGVSMTEAMWLSVRRRAETRGRATGHVAHDLLNGKESPLTKREVDFGLARAKERERQRSAGQPEEGQKRVVTERVRAEAEEHFGQFVGSLASWAPRVNGKKSPKVKLAANEKPSTAESKEASNIAVPTPKDDGEKSRKKLSRGQPLSAKDQNEKVAKEAKPDEEVYGGYFQF